MNNTNGHIWCTESNQLVLKLYGTFGDFEVCPFVKRLFLMCPLLGGSFIGGSTVVLILSATYVWANSGTPLYKVGPKW